MIFSVTVSGKLSVYDREKEKTENGIHFIFNQLLVFWMKEDL